ncbi:MAG: TfoX/Sxy family protein [Nitrospirota bacterium]
MPNDSFKDFVLDQLGEMPELTGKAMFGGYGLYHRATFFGIIHKGRLYFKTNALTQPAYASRGMQPFHPNAKQTLRQYYEVPVDILEDPQELAAWARYAVTLPTAQLPLPFSATPQGYDLPAPM